MRFDKLIHSFLLKTSSDHCAGAMRLGFDVHSSGSCYLQQKKPFLPFFQGYGPKGPQRSLSFLAHFLPLLCLLPIPPERLGFYFESTWTKNIGGPWKWKSAIAANYFCLAYKVYSEKTLKPSPSAYKHTLVQQNVYLLHFFEQITGQKTSEISNLWF